MIPVQRIVPFSVREWHDINTTTMFGALYVVYGPIFKISAYLVAGQFDAAQRRQSRARPPASRRSTLSLSSSPSRNGGRCRVSQSRTPGSWLRRDGP
jgi:hypothetical protein